MSDLDSLMRQAEAWLQPLGGDDGPCGADLEYDNEFLELIKTSEGKPETQFDAGAPPDWRAVRQQAEALFERTRDLRIAILWLRAVLSLDGVSSLVPGLTLVNGLLASHWDAVHPLPDPDDNDPFARANALAALPRLDGVLGEMLTASLVRIKGVGDIRLRDIEVAASQLTAREDEQSWQRDQLERILGSAEQEGAGLRAMLQQVQQRLKELAAMMDQYFGPGSASELKPALDVFARALAMIPSPESEGDPAGGEAGDTSDGSAAEGAGSRSGKGGLSGGVNSRAEAVRAIEMVCAYLERHEPTNPAPLFLRRASMLIERNFLELLKELAPAALDDVARIVGVDPSTVGGSEQ